MNTFVNLFSPRSVVAVFAAGLLFLPLSGCDSSGGLDDDSVPVSAEETAESIAVSLGENTGGVASDLTDAAGLLTSGTKSTFAKDITRSRECTYDDSDEDWTCTFVIEGARGRIDSLRVQRTVRAQFFDGMTVVRAPSKADSMTYELKSGDGHLTTPRLDHSHTVVPSEWSIARQKADTYGIALLSKNAGRDVSGTLSGERRKRERTAEIRRTGTDDLLWEKGNGLIGGTVEGTYDATVTVTRQDDSTVSREISLTYTATFSDGSITVSLEGGGERFNGETFEFDRDGLLL